MEIYFQIYDLYRNLGFQYGVLFSKNEGFCVLIIKNGA